jgi:hypothetical protein
MSKNPDPWPKGRYLRLGAPTGRFPDGYADDPACGTRGEPECLDEQQWKDYVHAEAKQKRAAKEAGRELEIKRLSQEERISRAVEEAKRLRRSVTRDLWVLEQMKAQGRPYDAVEKRVQALERNVYLGRAA